MTSGLLASCWAKLDWADRHAVELQRELADAFDAEKHPVVLERVIAPEPSPVVAGELVERNIFKIADMPRFTAEQSLLLGDVLNNYRSALDHMAWALVKDAGTRLNKKRSRGVAFPMAESRPEWDKSLGWKLPGVDTRLANEIRPYAPYHLTGPGRLIRTLGKLNNQDKHKFIIPAVAQHGFHSLRIRSWGCRVLTDINYLWPEDEAGGARKRYPLRVGVPVYEAVVMGRDVGRGMSVTGPIGVAPLLYGGGPVWHEVRFIGETCREVVSRVAAV